MTNKEAIEVLKESVNRNKVSLETLIDMMSPCVIEYVGNLIKAEEKAIEILGEAQKK